MKPPVAVGSDHDYNVNDLPTISGGSAVAAGRGPHTCNMLLRGMNPPTRGIVVNTFKVFNDKSTNNNTFIS